MPGIPVGLRGGRAFVDQPYATCPERGLFGYVR